MPRKSKGRKPDHALSDASKPDPRAHEKAAGS
jgi:hypothetical protein